MSDNKKIIEKYIDGFQKFDHAQILSCLTDTIVWEMPGFFHLEGKEAFDSEIENPAFTGSPIITMERMTEEANVVVLEGKVQGKKFFLYGNFFLIRHGLRVSRDEDTLLSESGIKQAKLTGQYLESKNLNCLFVSPTRRTQHTAEIINHYLQIPQVNDARLKERMESINHHMEIVLEMQVIVSKVCWTN